MGSSSGKRLPEVAFVGAVTWYLVLLVFCAAAKGMGGAAEIVVYGVTAALGLEFLVCAWPSLWGDAARDSRPQR